MILWKVVYGFVSAFSFEKEKPRTAAFLARRVHAENFGTSDCDAQTSVAQAYTDVYTNEERE